MQFFEEPAACLSPQRRRDLKEHPLQELLPSCTDNTLLEAIPVELRYVLEERR
jgi:hypothetical protein